MKSASLLVACWLGFAVPLAAEAAVTADWELSPPVTIAQNSDGLERQAREAYERGDFQTAIATLENLDRAYQEQGNAVDRAIVLRNLALVYQGLGEVDLARNILEESQDLIVTIEDPGVRDRAFVRALELEGQLELDSGHPQAAIAAWDRAAEIYTAAGDPLGATRTRVSTARALQSMGLYARAIDILSEVRDELELEPDILLKARALQSLGEALRVVGRTDESQAILEQSLTIAEQAGAREVVAATAIALGNTARLQRDPEGAIAFYERAAATSGSPQTIAQARLNQLQVTIEEENFDAARQLADRIRGDIAALPPSQNATYARINFAQSLIKLRDRGGENLASTSDIAEFLATAVGHSRLYNDKRSESYALGNLGLLYEKNGQRSDARELTEKALLLAQATNSDDIAYQWQWQLGRILKENGDRKGAIAAYSSAVDTLGNLRSDLVAISSDVQFSFRESVEPIYRELVSLLLQPGANIEQKDLIEARKTIEALQLAELDNFFRDACLDAKPAQIDRVDPSAAVFYTIILDDRLEVIAALPDAPLQHYTTFKTPEDVDDITEEALTALLSPRLRGRIESFLDPASEIYDWLIRPALADLEASNIETLVFVLDGRLRNLPMSALYDGEQFLVENYSIALTPGLQLLEPRAIAEADFSVLTGGLSEARGGFSALPSVREEVERIVSAVPADLLLNETFTEENFKEQFDRSQFPIVHLATHGEFSSNAEDTFVLTWNDRINANELESLLQSETARGATVELLVLSACRTAAGDDRAALGLAGVAVRAGARSTVASLWYISDDATAVLMTEFYQQLASKEVRKAEALRRAQVAILENDRYYHPYYWAAFVLVGNWL